MHKDEAVSYITSLLNRMFRIHAIDDRIFVGEFKCTDNEQNIILSKTYEYRMPTVTNQIVAASPEGSGTANMTSRFLGLVVVPGHYIRKIEVEGPLEGAGQSVAS